MTRHVLGHSAGGFPRTRPAAGGRPHGATSNLQPARLRLPLQGVSRSGASGSRRFRRTCRDECSVAGSAIGCHGSYRELRELPGLDPRRQSDALCPRNVSPARTRALFVSYSWDRRSV